MFFLPLRIFCVRMLLKENERFVYVFFLIFRRLEIKSSVSNCPLQNFFLKKTLFCNPSQFYRIGRSSHHHSPEPTLLTRDSGPTWPANAHLFCVVGRFSFFYVDIALWWLGRTIGLRGKFCRLSN